MKKLVTLLSFTFILSTFNVEAQRYPEKTNFQISLGVNLISNNGSKSPIENLNDWAFRNPFTIGIEYKWNSFLGVEEVFSFNKFKKNESLDGPLIADKDYAYFAADTNLKYYFNEHLNLINSEAIDLYVSLGFGIFKIEDSNGSFNFGGGANYWFNDNFGISGQGFAKFAFDSKNQAPNSNHIQYSLKALYRF